MSTAEDYEVFVSYAHLDNRPKEAGWITRFEKTLQEFLDLRVGRVVRIWRDPKLQGNDVFADEITKRFGQSRILISVLSPRYVDSEWCLREISEFCAQAERSGGLRIGNQLRVFKIVKYPADQTELPKDVAGSLGYNFFVEKEGVTIELDPDKFGKDLEPQYNFTVARLAQDATDLLQKLAAHAAPGGAGDEAGMPPAAGPSAETAITVFLAQCSHDVRGEHDRLTSELKAHGCAVLPDRRLSTDVESEYCEQVKAELARCKLSIHLIGTSYGAVPDGPSKKSTVHLQNELAAQRCKDGGFERLIWLPKSETSDEQQREFIRALHEDKEAQLGADLITGDFEELKNALHATLRKLAEPPPKPRAAAPAASGGDEASTERLVYLICVQQDQKATLPLRKHLKQAGIDVETPAFEGSATEVREANQGLLQRCDAVLVFYGSGNKAWRITVENDLKRAAAHRDGRPLLAQGIWLAEGESADKQDLVDVGDDDLIDARGGFEDKLLEGFVRRLRGEGGGS